MSSSCITVLHHTGGYHYHTGGYGKLPSQQLKLPLPHPPYVPLQRRKTTSMERKKSRQALSKVRSRAKGWSEQLPKSPGYYAAFVYRERFGDIVGPYVVRASEWASPQGELPLLYHREGVTHTHQCNYNERWFYQPLNIPKAPEL